MQLQSSGGPGASGGLGALTRRKLLVTRGQGALEDGQDTESWRAIPGKHPGPPCSSTSQHGQRVSHHPCWGRGTEPPPHPHKAQADALRQRPSTWQTKHKGRPTVSRRWTSQGSRVREPPKGHCPHPRPPTQTSAPQGAPVVSLKHRCS